jgi:uncharacterized protein (TIGR02145 family)
MKTIRPFLVAMIATIAVTASSCSKSEDENSSSNETPKIPTTVTDLDGNTYNTIILGNQVWMKENLNVTKYRNGGIIPQVQDREKWYNLTTGAWCYYENQTSNGVVYGKLYNWYAVNDSRGLSPKGWHIPNGDEWNLLDYFLATANSPSGGKMKEIGTTHWTSPNIGATNESDFTGLPGGQRYNTGDFRGLGVNGYWWSSKLPYTLEGPLNYHINNNSDLLIPHYHYKEYGFSVRCIKD